MGAFDGLWLDGNDEAPALPEPGEEDDPCQLHDPLPGFEQPALTPRALGT